MQPRTRSVLTDALAACDYIGSTIAGLSGSDYVCNEDVRSIVERKLITVGEALIRVRQRDEEVFGSIADARSAIALRNVIVHDYNDIDDGRVFLIVTELLPILRKSIAAALHDAVEGGDAGESSEESSGPMPN